MNKKQLLRKLYQVQDYLFNLTMSDNTSSIMLSLHQLDVTLLGLEPYYESINHDFIDVTDYDLKNLILKIKKIKQYVREIDRDVTPEDGKDLHELMNIMFETYVNDWSDKVYKLNRLEHEAFYLAKGSKYEEAIPKFQEYLAFMNSNPFLYIKIWLAHDEYVECLHQCKHNPKYYDLYVEALKENIELYKPCHHRLQRTTIRAQQYLNEIIKN